jgi:hypothetical protein
MLDTDESPRQARSQWFDLPAAARDWVPRPGSAAYYLPQVMDKYVELAARERIAEWDSLVGRLLRASMFDLQGNPRELRQLAEAVAAVAEHLADALGDKRA